MIYVVRICAELTPLQPALNVLQRTPNDRREPFFNSANWCSVFVKKERQFKMVQWQTDLNFQGAANLAKISVHNLREFQ